MIIADKVICQSIKRRVIWIEITKNKYDKKFKKL